MAEKFHYIAFHHDAFEADCAHLSTLEDGAYNRLLRLCFRQSKMSVPNDRQWLIRHLRTNEEEFDKAYVPIIKEFFKVSRGRLYNPGQRKHYENAQKVSSKRSDSGRRGARAKHGKDKKSNFTDEELAALVKFSDVYPPCDYRSPDATKAAFLNLSRKNQDMAIKAAHEYGRYIADNPKTVVLTPARFIKNGIFKDYAAKAPKHVSPVVLPEAGTPEARLRDIILKTHSAAVWRAWFASDRVVLADGVIYPIKPFTGQKIRERFMGDVIKASLTVSDETWQQHELANIDLTELARGG